MLIPNLDKTSSPHIAVLPFFFVMDSERKQRVSFPCTLNFFLSVLIIFVNSNVIT